MMIIDEMMMIKIPELHDFFLGERKDNNTDAMEKWRIE